MKQQQISGFTLLELMVTIAVLGIITAAAVPSFAGFLERQRVSTQAQEISDILNVARSEALTRLETVDVCWNQTNAAITVRSFSIQPGKMAILTNDDPAEVVRDVTFSDTGLFIDDTEADDCVSYSGSGRFDSTTATNGTLAFGICTESGETLDSKAVTINATGRVSISNNAAGQSINCS